MYKNDKKRLLAGLICGIAPLAVSAHVQPDHDRPNVLLICVDDLRPALGCYGDKLAITPNIDRLAGQGVLFGRHYVQAPSSAPSRTSMLTGLRPDEVGVTDHKTHFRDTRPEAITLPQLFKNNGYRTISLGKVFHYSSGYNDTPSWDEEHFLKGTRNYVLKENLETRGKPMSSECVEVHDTAYVDGKIADKALQLLTSFSEDGTDFFLAVGHLKPHLPFNAPKKYWDMYEREDFKLEQNRGRPAGAPEIAFHKWQELRGYKDVPGEGPISPEKEMELRHAYYACVSYIDAQIGKVLDALDMLGLRENTIIVFWGDHGYHLGEQDLWCKSTNFELAAHSPLIISAPGTSKAGVKCNAIVESLDIYPTLSDLCGISSEWVPSGTSLKPLLEDPEGGWENIAFNQFARPYEAAIGARVPVSHMGYSVRTDEWRYTAWFNVATGEFEFPELYPAAASIAPPENLAGNPQFRDVEATHLKLVSDFRKRYNK